MNLISGSCLCGSVRFECRGEFEQFHLCHCTQCQKTSGSAYASNLLTDPENIVWLSGEKMIARYDLPDRIITSAFCTACGCPMPYLSKSGKELVIPAGSLDSGPHTLPQGNIFWAERATWYESGVQSKKHDGFPD